MCLDAAVMGICPTFINQSWKRKKKGNSTGGGGGVEQEGMRGDAERERAGEGGRKRVLVGRREGGKRQNKAHIDVPNTAAGVS